MRFYIKRVRFDGEWTKSDLEAEVVKGTLEWRVSVSLAECLDILPVRVRHLDVILRLKPTVNHRTDELEAVEQTAHARSLHIRVQSAQARHREVDH